VIIEGGSGALPQFREFRLSNNQNGDAGIIADACGREKHYFLLQIVNDVG
jgi:hypothetical protein